MSDLVKETVTEICLLSISSWSLARLFLIFLCGTLYFRVRWLVLDNLNSSWLFSKSKLNRRFPLWSCYPWIFIGNIRFSLNSSFEIYFLRYLFKLYFPPNMIFVYLCLWNNYCPTLIPHWTNQQFKPSNLSLRYALISFSLKPSWKRLNERRTTLLKDLCSFKTSISLSNFNLTVVMILFTLICINSYNLIYYSDY